MAVIRKHFNSCTMMNLMKKPSFDAIDPTLEWCQANGM